MTRLAHLRSSTVALGAALFAVATVWWIVRMVALFHLSAGEGFLGFWVPYYTVAGILFAWGAYRFWTSQGRIEGMTWWMLAAPLTLLVSPFAAAAWLAYLLVERRRVGRSTTAGHA